MCAAFDPVDTEPSGSESGVPSDNTDLLHVLAGLADEGFTHNLTPRTGGALRCDECGGSAPVGDFDVVHSRRLEGASDPDDLQLVVGARCPGCGTGGVAVVAYGPTAGEEDADVVAALPR